MQEVSGSNPLISTRTNFPGSPSSRGLGHRPFTAATGVRIPLGMPSLAKAKRRQFAPAEFAFLRFPPAAALSPAEFAWVLCCCPPPKSPPAAAKSRGRASFAGTESIKNHVIPAKAGIQTRVLAALFPLALCVSASRKDWIPAFAGMTWSCGNGLGGLRFAPKGGGEGVNFLRLAVCGGMCAEMTRGFIPPPFPQSTALLLRRIFRRGICGIFAARLLKILCRIVLPKTIILLPCVARRFRAGRLP